MILDILQIAWHCDGFNVLATVEIMSLDMTIEVRIACCVTRKDSHVSQVLRQVDGLQVAAVLERIAFQIGNLIRQGDRLQVGAISECILLNS